MDRRTFFGIAGTIGVSTFTSVAAVELQVEPNLQWELEDEKVASNDRNKLPIELRSSVAYFTTATVDGESRLKLAQTLCGIVPSLSQHSDLSKQIPKQISDTVWKVDLYGLGWQPVWHKVMSTYYPYYRQGVDRHKYVPQIVRADWFCADLYDSVETDIAQYLLLYSGKVPKNRDEFFKFWEVQSNPEFVYGMIEGRSGVAVNDKSGEGRNIRQIENRTTARRGYCWITKDSARIVGITDPIATLHLGPDGGEFDASEYIVGIYKVLNGEVAGCLQSYFLTDGNRKLKNGQRQQGVRQAKAPVDIVEDKTNVRGREIRNSSSCVYCHEKGIIPPTQNEFRRYIINDTRLNLDYKTKYVVERYQGSDLQREVLKDQESYEEVIQACTGMSGPEFSNSYQSLVREYISGVSLERLANELSLYYPRGYLTPNELQLALASVSNKGGLGGRDAAVAEEDMVNRDTVIQNWYRYQEIINSWRKNRW